MSKQIHWPRVFIEGVVIVGSILLAFGIDAWWEGRQERVRVGASLANVAAEITVNRTEILRALDRNERRRLVLFGFLDRTSDEVSLLPNDSLIPVVQQIRPPNLSDPGGGALEHLLTSGDLSLIPDSDLRNTLVEG